MVLVFFLAVSAIFYYRNKIIKELESLLSLPSPTPSVSSLLQKYSQVLQEAFLKADYGEITASFTVKIPLAEEEKYSRKGKDEGSGLTYVTGYLGSIYPEDKSLVIRLSETEWVKAKVEENAQIRISDPTKDQLRRYDLGEAFAEFKIGDWVSMTCILEECKSVNKVRIFRSIEEVEMTLGGSKNWVEAPPLGWCPPVRKCWERLIKFRPTGSSKDVLMRGLVQSLNTEKNEITLLMEGGSATVRITPDAVFSSMIDPEFSKGFSQIKEGDKLIVRCAFEITDCYYVNSIVKVEK